jgi:diguanylate cyclase (GGDEF)-like protein/PAS domain S-box-containing protein
MGVGLSGLERDGSLVASLLLEGMGQSVIGLDRHWQVQYWNPASERLYGFSSLEVMGRKIIDLGIIPAPETASGRAGSGPGIVDGLTAGREWAGEFWMRHRAGTDFPAFAMISPVEPMPGTSVTVVVVSKDITERKHREAALRRVSAMVESSGDAIIGFDMEGRVTSWNAGAVEMLGWQEREAVGQSFWLLVSTSGAEDSRAGQVGAAVSSSETFVKGLESRWRHRDGSVVIVSLTVSPVFGEDGQRVGSSAIARDITELKRLQVAAEAERERLLAAQAMAHVGSVEHDIVADRWTYSEELARIYGLRPGEQISRPQFLALVHPEDREIIREAWSRLDAGAETAEYEFRIIRADTAVRWMLSRVRMVHDGPDRKPVRFLATVMDITDRKKADEVLHWQARHDALTGLPNRYQLTEALQGLLGRESGKAAVMFVDIDRFKTVNDGIGHTAGDALLVLLGERLRAAVRPGDMVGRFGGDEFVIVCPGLGLNGAAAAAERIRTAAAEPFAIHGRKIYLNVSVGIAMAGPEDTPESLLGGADAAMYQAKAAGGDRAAVYDSSLLGEAAGRLDLESDLRQGLERNEFRLYYQPIIDLDTDQTVGFEALLRWHHGEHGVIMPCAFIPLAEETGLVIPIGTWALQTALAQAQEWRTSIAGAENISIAVNISGRQLLAPDFPDVVAAAVQAAGISATAVNLEVTETVLMRQPELAPETLRRLIDLGVGLSIDDFGTGYSSLSYLRWLSARALKIDRSFIEELGTGPHGASIVALITGMADNLDLDVVAEGVETPTQLTELRRRGVRKAQGYYWSRPIPADQVPNWLQSRAATRKSPTDAQ